MGTQKHDDKKVGRSGGGGGRKKREGKNAKSHTASHDRDPHIHTLSHQRAVRLQHHDLHLGHAGRRLDVLNLGLVAHGHLFQLGAVHAEVGELLEGDEHLALVGHEDGRAGGLQRRVGLQLLELGGGGRGLELDVGRLGHVVADGLGDERFVGGEVDELLEEELLRARGVGHDLAVDGGALRHEGAVGLEFGELGLGGGGFGLDGHGSGGVVWRGLVDILVREWGFSTVGRMRVWVG